MPRQGNNSYIFPGIGLGAIAVAYDPDHRRDVHGGRARRWPTLVTQADLDQGSLYPPLKAIREVSAHIAAAVAAVAYRDGLARVPRACRTCLRS